MEEKEKVKIIFEDKDLLLVEKVTGLTTTKEKKGEKGTLEDILIEIRPNDLDRNGIVHRLDKGTSGLIIMAKNELALKNLKEQFKKRKVIKKYNCLIEGDSSADGTINAPIGRSKYSFGKFKVGVDGKESLTEFKVIDKYKKGDKKYSLLEINLKTGRTHQIRVHMSYLGWPLVGDKTYGGKTDEINRPFLHAVFIQFKHPVSNEVLSFNSDLAVDLKECLKKYEKI